ncbi:MAG: carbohydrate binding domain-containing protein, partial [Victivallaceae bacterium]
MKNILSLLLVIGVFVLTARLEAHADDFESGITNWSAIQEDSGDQVNLSWEKLNTCNNSVGALRVVVRIPENQARTIGNTGARYSCGTIAANSRIRVSFDAKSLYGSSMLNIVRQVSDSTCARVKLTPEWKSYTVDLDVASSTSYLVFNTVSVFDGADPQCVVSGEFILDNVTVSAVSEAYVLNSYFNGSTANWQGYRNTAVDASIIAYNSGSGPDGKSGYMNVNISTSTLLYSHQTGAYCITNNIPANSRLQVTFWAKSVSGSNYLNVERMYGGGSRAQVVLSSAWKKYSLTLDVDYTTSGIIFNPVATLGYSGFTNVTSGNFLIDNVHIDVVTNSVSNYKFDSSITGWNGLRNGSADATMLSRETTDTWGGSAGALRVNISTGIPLNSCSSGAQYVFSSSLKAYNRVKVSFWAKSVSGSPYLNIERVWAGARQQVTLTGSWSRYDVYLDLPYDTQDIVFNTVDAIGFSGFSHVVNGVFLLDNVIISQMPEESLTASFTYDRPTQYSNFTTISTAAALSTAINSGTTNYIYLPPGDYTINNPITINRNTPLFIHGGNRMGTKLIPSDNTKPLFIVQNAPLVNITGLYLQGPTVTEYRSFVFQNFVPTIFEMQACFVDRAAVEIQGRGSFTFQG